MNTKGNEPAFPSPPYQLLPHGMLAEVTNGMTLRQYTAIKAMEGLLAWDGNNWNCQKWAAKAVEQADALLAELAK